MICAIDRVEGALKLDTVAGQRASSGVPQPAATPTADSRAIALFFLIWLELFIIKMRKNHRIINQIYSNSA